MINIIYDMAITYIRIPEQDEIAHLKNGFRNIGNFEDIILSIDGTQTQIQRPAGNDAIYFDNRK